MRITLKTVAAAAAALTSTIGMAQVPEHRFVHAGDTYIYTSTPAHGGRTVIAGQRLPAGEKFRLVVNRDRVTGISGGMPVSFRTSTARGAADGVKIAAN